MSSYTAIYCLEVCPLNKSDLRSLDFTVIRLLMKLFRTSNKDIINECCVYFDFKLPSEILPECLSVLSVDVVIAEIVGYTVVITAP